MYAQVKWRAPCILVQELHENREKQPPKFVVDYKGLNSVTCGDGYPIPSPVAQGKGFGRYDLASGYWQVPLRHQYREKTAFCTHVGLYKFLRLPLDCPYPISKNPKHSFRRLLISISG